MAEPVKYIAQLSRPPYLIGSCFYEYSIAYLVLFVKHKFNKFSTFCFYTALDKSGYLCYNNLYLGVNMPEFNIKLSDHFIPKYFDLVDDVLDHRHTHYKLYGGRGSTKSSAISLLIPLIMLNNPKVHAICFRKVANTLKTSVYAQLEWAIEELGWREYFRFRTNPMDITFKPTGQKILFMGLDDAGKIKSVKVPFGYIGITWWEEEDQYTGETEIRKVLQSTMRGGDKFWDFRSFNPPISAANWANKDVLLNRDDTFVMKSCYLDVPKEWLGQAFIDEAEYLKEINPKAYQHEYLGDAIGDGGNVFENVKAYVMPDELIKEFDRIYNGIDWGYFPDPFVFVRMHFDVSKRDLYIFAEHIAYKQTNRAAFDQVYNERKLASLEELVTADSAEPKSIADFNEYGANCRPAEKGADSVTYSMKWLQGLNHIYIDPNRCPFTLEEFITYEYERDKDGNVISGYPDIGNHAVDGVRYALNRHWKRRGN